MQLWRLYASLQKEANMGFYSNWRLAPARRYQRRFYTRKHYRQVYRPRRWRWFPYCKRRIRRRYSYVRQRHSKIYSIYVRGWEPLGINGSYITDRNDIGHAVNNQWRAQNAKSFSCQRRETGKYVDQIGGWGNFQLTMKDLFDRMQMGLAEASESFTPYSDFRFDWIRLYGVPTKWLDWVYVASSHFPIDNQQTDNRAHWLHPLHLMLQKNRTFVPSLWRSRRKLFYKKIVYPSSQMTSEFYDKTFFKNVPFLYFGWSYVDLNLPSGAPQNDQLMKKFFNTGKEYKNDWYKLKKSEWRDRIEFEKANTGGKDNDTQRTDNLLSNWSAFFKESVDQVTTTVKSFFFGNTVSHTPMCPPVLWSKELCQASLFYHIKFSATGRTLQPADPGTTTEIGVPRKDACDQACPTCLRDEDLTPSGTILPKSLARIVGTHNYDRLEDSRSGESSEEEEPGTSTSAKIQQCLEYIQRCIRK